MSLRNRRVLYIVLALAFIIGCLLLYWYRTPPPSIFVSGGMRFEMATTSAAQAQGLGGRTEVPFNYGMLFVFPLDDYYGFWMKDMLVPLDILWLSDTGTIVGIENSIATSTYPTVFYPPKPVRYVLEIQAGSARARGWGVGSTTPIPLQE